MSNLHLTFKGRHHSKETKKYLSLIRKGKPKSAEHIEKVRLTLLGKTWEQRMGIEKAAALREKLRLLYKGKHHSIERIEKNRLGHLGVKHSFEHIRKVALANTGQKRSAEYSLMKSKMWKLKWQNPTFREKMLVATNKPLNKSEEQLLNLLNKFYPSEWKFVGDGKFWITYKNYHYNPDFINVNGKKLIIELFGKHWHQEDEEIIRSEAFAHYGYKTLFVWDYELKNLEKIQYEIENFCEAKEGNDAALSVLQG